MSDIVEFRHLEYLVAIAERKNFSKVIGLDILVPGEMLVFDQI
jgi:hypothetical protein